MISLSLVSIALLFSIGDSLSLLSRRRIVERLTTGIGAVLLIPDVADAVQGAAEYDFEYYMRDLLKGNPKQGVMPASVAPPAPPPRVLKGPLLPLLLDKECSTACVPAKVLTELVPIQSGDLTEKMSSFRNAASRSFQSKAPWKDENVADQYYFDLTAYALWRTAADLLPDYVTRDKFARNIGREIYASSLIKKATKSANAPLTSTISSVTEILDEFTSAGYCKSYKLGDNTKPAIFDEFDDEGFAGGAPIDALVSIYEPATLGASLQITGEQSRFAPEYVGATLAAMWSSIGIKVSYETYFVDPVYRPNPKDYFPNEQLLQFTLSKM